jgi:lysophospholipase L1-like esterase
MGHADFPIVYPAYHAKLSQLVREARDDARRVEMVIFGDSMATGSGANGSGFPAAMTVELHAVLGLPNVPATAWVPAGNNTSDDAFISNNTNGSTYIDFPAASAVPILMNWKFAQIADSAGNGLCNVLIHDNRHQMAMFIGRSRGWTDAAGVVRRGSIAFQAILVDSTIAAGPNTTTVNATWRSTVGPQTNFFATADATHNGLVATPFEGGWHKLQVPNAPASWAQPYMQCRLTGPGAGQRPGIALTRFIQTGVGGFAITGAGAGGGKAVEFATLYSGLGPSLRAMGADIIVFAYGTNDSGTETAAAYKIGVQANINLVRAAVPGCLIILLAGVMRTSGTPATLDSYVDVLAELCDENDDVVLFNEQRLLAMLGLNPERENVSVAGSVLWNSGTTYALGDIVHTDALVTESVSGRVTTGRQYWRSNWGTNLNRQPGTDGTNRSAWEPIVSHIEDGIHLSPLGNFVRARVFAMLLAQASAMGHVVLPATASSALTLSVTVADEPSRHDLRWFQHEAREMVVDVLDPSGAAYSLTGATLRLLIWSDPATPLHELETPLDIAVTGNRFTLTIPDSLTATAGTFGYAVRIVSDGNRVLMHGLMDLSAMPKDKV